MASSSPTSSSNASREWGIHRIYGYPGRRDQRLARRARPRRRRPGVHPGAPRGDGRVHGVRPREVHRRGRRLHGDLRPRRDPPPERPLRREARPRAGRRDRRPAEAHVARRRLPAGGRPADALQGRAPSTSRCAWSPAQARHLVDRAVRIALGRARGLHAHLPERRPGGEGGRVAAARARRGLLERRLRGAARRAAERRARPRRRDPERGREGRDPRRPGRARRRATRSSSVAELLGAGVAKALLGTRGAAGRPAVRDRLDRPARHAAELRADGRAATRC